MNKIGILTCSSKLYPSMSIHIMEGLYAYCVKQNISTDDFIIESIGHAGDHKHNRQKVESLILRPDIRIIIAFVDVLGADQIEPFVNAAGKVLITVDMGAHVPGIYTPSPHHISISLQSAYATVLGIKQAMEDGRKSFSFCSSMLDAGYTQIYAAWRCIEKLGSKVNYHYNTPIISSETNLDYLKAHLMETPSDAMILQFCALGFEDFQRTYQESELDLHLPVVVAPFLLEREWLKEQEIVFTNCKGFVAWEQTITNSVNTEFKQEILEQFGKEASIFHVLGWDTATVMHQVLNELKTVGANAIKVVQNVTQQSISSPRGELVWNKKLRRFVGPLYEAVIVKKEGVFQPELTGIIKDNIQNWEEFASDVPMQFSNWQNMYLCPT